MSVTPTGLPVWTRTADHTVYGGHTDKQNYQSQGAINPRTDVTAEQFCRLVEDLAECARTAAFAEMSITCNDTAPAAPTINWIRMATGVLMASYEGDNPPTGFPTAARLGNGAVSVTFSASYTDAYGVSAAFTPTLAIPAQSSTGTAYVTWDATGSVVTLRAFTSAGVADSDASFSVEIA